jgi:hypothetical protein
VRLPIPLLAADVLYVRPNNMKNPIPIQFLVGLTRLISIYYCVRAIDQLFGAIMNYQMMKSMAYDKVINTPNALSIYIPGLLIYLFIAIAIWFAAPLVCRIAIPSVPEDNSNQESQICWNEVMIFLVGTLFVGMGITRLSSLFIAIYNASMNKTESYGHEFGLADKSNAVTTIILLGFGVILMKRFPSIYRWIQVKCQPVIKNHSDEQDAPRNR